jgi:hypothetical protein
LGDFSQAYLVTLLETSMQLNLLEADQRFDLSELKEL